MTEHFHPSSDKTFLVTEGRLSIEFDSGPLELDPGQLLTIPADSFTGPGQLPRGQ
jgi:mannose-6-phosphate isomerase-like protein (cupin superfamily)